MKTNIVEQLKEFHVFLNGLILLGNIEEINVPNLEQPTKIDVELKVRGIHPDVNSVFGNSKTRLEVQGTLENDQGEKKPGGFLSVWQRNQDLSRG